MVIETLPRDQLFIISKVWNDAQRIRQYERVSSKALRQLISDIT
jgi:diketogulonate reductase-like aldo/keto reductase